jgi:hypothetical protein
MGSGGNSVNVAYPILMAGAWGLQDDEMLRRVSDNIANYVIQNYETAIGGPTGLE